MKKVKEFLHSKYAKLSLVAGSAVSMLTVGAFAEEATTSGLSYDTITSGMLSGLSELGAQLLTMLGSITAIAVVIFGGAFIVRLGKKWFMGLSK